MPEPGHTLEGRLRARHERLRAAADAMERLGDSPEGFPASLSRAALIPFLQRALPALIADEREHIFPAARTWGEGRVRPDVLGDLDAEHELILRGTEEVLVHLEQGRVPTQALLELAQALRAHLRREAHHLLARLAPPPGEGEALLQRLRDPSAPFPHGAPLRRIP